MHLPVGELKVPPDPVSSFKAACASRQHINSPAEAERAQQSRKQDNTSNTAHVIKQIKAAGISFI